LTGQVAIVTGSSRGIGRAVAVALAANGAAVVVNGRDEGAAGEVADEIVAEGSRAVAVAGSAADEAVAEDLLAAALEFGEVDVLINCAGTAEPPGSSILTISREQWQDGIDAHLTSTFSTCRLIAPRMVARGGGAIINTSSHAFTGGYGGTAYPAGKGAVNSLTLALAAELREHGVRVNAVCPGARTRLSTGEDYQRQIHELHRRAMIDDLTRDASLKPAPPEYVAPLYVFLASDLAAGITGQIYAGSGCYLGRFPHPEAEFLTWRDHENSPPLSLAEIAEHLTGTGPRG
jgi:3-oxoacyl-[acyl-carrier protein] reductase